MTFPSNNMMKKREKQNCQDKHCMWIYSAELHSALNEYKLTNSLLVQI